MYIIDGHNLIPKLRGLSLADFDDEDQLIQRLQIFSRVTRKRVEVFFDDAPPGQSGTRRYGTVRAHFVPIASEADQAIHDYLEQLGKQANRWTVVSSDHRVQADARERGAKRVTSDVFALLLEKTLEEDAARNAAQHPAPPPPPKETAQVNEDPLSEWFQLFHLDPEEAARPLDITSRPRRDKPKTPKKPASGAGKAGGADKTRKNHGFEKK
ncbi:MAG TPA: NYN domain-containing protein [Anaerolineaceae bacterium]